MTGGFFVLLMLIIALVGGITAGGIIGWSNRRPPKLPRAEKRKLLLQEDLISDLRETAYDHRDLDSALAEIMIDKIRDYERGSRKELE